MQIIQESDQAPPVEPEKEAISSAQNTGITTQEDALQVLSALQAELPLASTRKRLARGGGRREERRWIPPDTVTVEVYDGAEWHPLDVLECGGAGVRVIELPDFVGDSPAILRLTTPDSGIVLVLGTVVWHDQSAGTAGLQFTFQNDEDREAWFEGFVEALLSRHAMN